MSDHYQGNSDAYAIDLSVKGQEGDQLLAHIMKKFGYPKYRGGSWFNVTLGGYRYQIGWRVANHFDHIHIGVKKIAGKTNTRTTIGSNLMKNPQVIKWINEKIPEIASTLTADELDRVIQSDPNALPWFKKTFNLDDNGNPIQELSKIKTKSDYINWITPLAKEVGKKYGIPWQAIIAQTGLETGWGKSQLLQKYNNFGGIKAVGSEESVTFNTREFINGKYKTISSKFAKWPTPLEGLEGYAKFFHKNKRYSNALQYKDNPYKFIEEIKKAGYATDPNYVDKLHKIINTDILA
jgi:hypothetical protein